MPCQRAGGQGRGGGREEEVVVVTGPRTTGVSGCARKGAGSSKGGDGPQ